MIRDLATSIANGARTRAYGRTVPAPWQPVKRPSQRDVYDQLWDLLCKEHLRHILRATTQRAFLEAIQRHWVGVNKKAIAMAECLRAMGDGSDDEADGSWQVQVAVDFGGADWKPLAERSLRDFARFRGVLSRLEGQAPRTEEHLERYQHALTYAHLYSVTLACMIASNQRPAWQPREPVVETIREIFAEAHKSAFILIRANELEVEEADIEEVELGEPTEEDARLEAEAHTDQVDVLAAREL